jgi:hypothetical protein
MVPHAFLFSGRSSGFLDYEPQAYLQIVELAL